ncbi:ABC-type transport auxiliary lipoprotein family protein [Dechloromonas sp. H13]|uniref:ABC-type transport auxiliary lipoprotein family protein n=1 Tax=Dechloromonas sp. H13 TaxID=2570193 RepID=UPI001291FFA0|nr:ABC-type transport auxiliary lipoprotein family protein [Dechloromonas sp. H13]
MWRFLIVVCSLVLAACYGTGKRGGDSALAIYDFGPPASSVATQRSELAVEVRAPLWFDSLGIEYRLAYAEPGRLRDYTRSRWAGPPAQLVQQRLVQQLGLMPAGQGRTRCVVRIDIDEFSQIFDTPTTSHGVIKGRVQLLDRSRRSLAGYELRIEKPAPSPDARGGVAALTAAVDQLVADILAWEQRLKGGGEAAACLG